MLKIQSLTLKNFLSVGNVTQCIKFDQQEIVLVLGENLDLGGNDNRNGTGKTTIINGISYALFGKPLVNVKFDNLINKTNSKNMLVTLDFEFNNIKYRIERGRRPGIFKFIKNGIENDSSINEDDTQGEGKHTQDEIERLIGISHEMCKHTLTLNTYVEPFLSLKTNDQRMIIEQLLGITKLSEKAEKLKEECRKVKDSIKEEEFRITAATETNKRIEQNISNLQNKSNIWISNKEQKIQSFQKSTLSLLNVDIDSEIKLHKSKKEIDDLSAEYRALSRELNNADKEVNELTKSITKLDKMLTTSKAKICPTCNQEMDKATHTAVHSEYVIQHTDSKAKLHEKTLKRNEIRDLSQSVSSMIPKMPVTFYKTIEEAYNHKSSLDKLGDNLSSEIETIDPYIEQIDLLRRDGLQVIDFTKLNELSKLRDHQEFLLKLLTNKDSFIRKKIIDQNITFLNNRLVHYLTEIGLPHTVMFKSDLEVEIGLYGKEFDFDNLSRGERTRVVLSLSWAFRDVFESMNHKINLLFVDELIDAGLDSNGVESAVAILKKMARDNKRNVYLISHRDELSGRVSNVLKVIKENGFTSFESVTI